MNKRIISSRKKFAEAKDELLALTKPEQKKKRSDRSSWQLTKDFFQLLRGQYKAMAFALATLTVATLLALMPPAATKIIVDYVLGEEPIPDYVPAWVPREQWPLLMMLTVGVLAVSLVKLFVHIWGRWHATRVTKLLQMSVRKKVFSHVMRLPLHRIQELKSGGAASILRQDAGSVGDLVFGLLYNPWRAIIQLVGSLSVLAFVDWRLLLGALFLIPLVFFTHRTWIGRIRPQHRRIRAEREKVDGLATEAFGGMRVVRAFGRQRSETTRIMSGNHLMGRQELYAWWSMRGVEIVWEVLMPMASAALLGYGGYRVLQGALSLGDLVMFLAYSADAAWSVGRARAECRHPAERPFGIGSHHRSARGTHGTRPRSRSRDRVGRRASHFGRAFLSATQAQVILPCKKSTSTFKPGETIALVVGPSGSGKTTLCNLLARFYEPDQRSDLARRARRRGVRHHQLPQLC